MDQHRSQNFPTAGDAVREAAQSNKKRQHPDQHHRASDRMTAADQPGNQRNQPSTDDSAPENMRVGGACRFPSKLRHGVDIFRTESASTNCQQSKQKGANNIAGQTYRYNEPYTAAAIILLGVSLAAVALVRRMERHLAPKSGNRGALERGKHPAY